MNFYDDHIIRDINNDDPIQHLVEEHNRLVESFETITEAIYEQLIIHATMLDQNTDFKKHQIEFNIGATEILLSLINKRNNSGENTER